MRVDSEGGEAGVYRHGHTVNPRSKSIKIECSEGVVGKHPACRLIQHRLAEGSAFCAHYTEADVKSYAIIAAHSGETSFVVDNL